MRNQLTIKDTEISKLKLDAKQSDNKLRSFFDSSSVIHLLIDTQLNIIDYNKAAQVFIQKHYKINPLYGIKIKQCLHHEHLIGFMESYQKALLGISSQAQRIFSYGDEEIVWFITYEPATDCDGSVIGISFNAIDITDQVARDEKISSQFHSMNEIAHIHSHNLRRPVANIIGLMDMFKYDDYSCSMEGLFMLELAVSDLKMQLENIEYFTKR